MRRKTRRCRKGGAILGIGREGCVVDSIRCTSPTLADPVAVKVFFTANEPSNVEISKKLAETDPDELRFTRYHSVSCLDAESNPDVLECGKGKSPTHMVGMRRLLPLDTRMLTREQYRYLRASLDHLQKLGIVHGDLPGNVMVDPRDGMPRLIDWGSAYLEPGNTSDVGVFLGGQFFRVGVKGGRRKTRRQHKRLAAYRK